MRAAGGTRARRPRPLPVLVELGHAGGRTGCRSIGEALAVGQAVAASRSLRLAGAAGFEGGIGHDGTAAPRWAPSPAFCRELRTLGDLLADRPAPAGRAGGRGRQICQRGRQRVLRPRGERAHRRPAGAAGADGGAAQRRLRHPRPRLLRAAGARPRSPAASGPALAPALELWARVLSAPEPGLAIAGAGRRDVVLRPGHAGTAADPRGPTGRPATPPGCGSRSWTTSTPTCSVPAGQRAAPR